MKFKLLTPQQTHFDADIKNAVIPGAEGYIGFLEGHVPYVTPVKTGIIEISADFGTHFFAVSGGYCEISSAGIVVLAEFAQGADDIDTEQVRNELRNAEEKLANADDETSLAALKHARDLAEVTLELAQKSEHK